MNNVFKKVKITHKLLLIVLGLMCTNQLNGNFFNKHWCDKYKWTGFRGGLYKPKFMTLGLTQDECKRRYNFFGISTAPRNIISRPQMNANTANRSPINAPMTTQAPRPLQYSPLYIGAPVYPRPLQNPQSYNNQRMSPQLLAQLGYEDDTITQNITSVPIRPAENNHYATSPSTNINQSYNNQGMSPQLLAQLGY